MYVLAPRLTMYREQKEKENEIIPHADKNYNNTKKNDNHHCQ